MINPLSLFYTVRSYVEAYAGLIGRRFVSVIWIAALAICIWFYGYLLGYGSFRPLESVQNRLIVIGLLIAGWIGYLIYSIIKARRADGAFIDGIAGESGSSPETEAKAEVEILRQRLKDALILLRKVAKKRFGYVYELPWYLLMGAPGSGKTTSLLNSGLKFPLGDAAGAEQPVQGIGGTRNCNWWFSEEAILIDTAGRYTTQGDFSGIDKAGWNGFLGLLKKYRPSEPVNGVLVTLSIADLLSQDPSERLSEIRSIRQRLAEMDDALGARVPVYVILTKADLLNGFVPFFDGLPKSEREQVWGMTFDLAASQTPTELPAQFLSEFDLLQDRVNTLLLERLQQEPDLDTRGRIFQLPAQMSLLREPVHEMLTELCSGSKLIAPPFIRGVYLSSGTQQPAVRPRAAAQPASMRRSYFLSRLFSNVIFEEAALVSRDKRLSRRQVILRRTAYALAGCVSLFILAGWVSTYMHNTRAISQAEARLLEFEKASQQITIRDVDDADFLQVLPVLNSLAATTSGFDEPKVIPLGFGLDQKEKVEGTHRLTYAKALNAFLLPRLMVHLQNELHRDDLGTADVFDNLKLYVMLGNLGPLDPEFASSRAEIMFARLYPGEGRRPAREALARHVEALVERPLASITIDDRLVAEARRKIEQRSVAQRAYDMLHALPAVRSLPSWNASAALGGGGAQAFVRRSGASLREGLPGLYTRTGFLEVVVPQINAVAAAAIAEDWVRGRDEDPGITNSAVAREAVQLYLSDFQERWRVLLADIAVRPAHDLADMTQVTRTLAVKSDNPLQRLAEAVARDTDLYGSAESDPERRQAVAQLPVDLGEAAVPYDDLRRAISVPEGEKSQIAAFLPLIDSLYTQISRAASSSADVAQIFDAEGQLANANQTLLSEARRLPAPLDIWMAGLAANVDGLAVKTARQTLGPLWETQGARLCRDAIAGRYPFDRGASRDVAMDDFVRMFGPEGAFETFLTKHLSAFVDMSSSPWTWRGSATGASDDEAHSLRQFEHARAIRQAFFAGGAQPAVNMNIEPVSLSQSSNAVILEIESERVVYFHGPVRSKALTWPARRGFSQSRLAFQPGGWERALTREGDWSVMRLFDSAEITPLSDDKFRARFNHTGQSAVFEVQVGSVLNPFTLKALSDFRCPMGL